MLASTLLLALASVASASPLTHSLTGRNNDGAPVVDLGRAGKYRGIVQNNGTVESWKGIPYAQPPVGQLRYKGPKALQDQSDEVQDVSDDALRCVQFGSESSIIGVKAGPGVEDCLKLWVWKPVSAKKGDKLPVMVYTHGGGLQYSSAPNNDFSDWVGQEQNFIAVNPAYRLGGLGFFASEELTAEGESANAGLLDSRMAYDWVKQNIAEFGGNPDDITIMGQSGGGYAVAAQLALYDGSKPNFQKAIPRSIQRSSMWTIEQLKDRNTQYAEALGCPADQSQLACFREQTPEALVEASRVVSDMNIPGKDVGWGGAGFVPTIDGVTLTDHLTALFLNGKFAKKPLMVGYVRDEAGGGGLRDVPELTVDDVGLYNVTQYADEIVGFYAVNATFGDVTNTGTFFLDNQRASLLGFGSFGESGISGSERLLARAFSKKDTAGVWSFRFEAPTVNTTGRNSDKYPLALVTHSADNSYLQNATAIMTPTELALAKEWRAYVGSFIRTGDPNKEKLKTAPEWHKYGQLDFEESPLRLVPRFHFEANPEDAPTTTQMEVVNRAQLQRIDYFLSDKLQAALHN